MYIPHHICIQVQELKFYDIQKSPIYRYSMTNAFVNHIDTTTKDIRDDYNTMLMENNEFRSVYKPIFEMKPTTPQITLQSLRNGGHI